ncbi:hypothetical protein GHR37_13910 [Achromobacter xylosoxidans]|nr:hypothetical protein [Achromobacter xylosoxidans]
MNGKVAFLQSAVDDLHEIRRYIRKRFSQAVWQDSYARIKKAILNLERFPHAGPSTPSGRSVRRAFPLPRDKSDTMPRLVCLRSSMDRTRTS